MKECIEKKTFQSKVIAVLEYLLMLFFIIEFNTPYTYFPIVVNTIQVSCVIIILVLILIRFHRFKAEPLAFLVFIGALVPMLNVAGGKMIRYIVLYLAIFPLLLHYLIPLIIKKYEDVKKFFLRFSNIVFFLAIISLFFWYWGSMKEVIPYTALIPSNWSVDRFIPTYYGVYFETQTVDNPQTNISIIRNSGLFNEAPMYNMVLCTALAIERFFREKISKIKIIVLIVTIVTTISSTGFFFLTAYIIVIIFIRARQYRKTLLILTPIIVGFVFFISSAIVENKKDTGEASYNSRVADIEKCISVGMDNPLFGLEIMHVADEFGGNKGNFGYSNSLFAIFAHGGIYLFSLYFICLFVIPVISLRRKIDWKWSIMILFYLMLFTVTLSHYRYLTILFLSYSIAFWNGKIKMSKKTVKQS